MMKDVLKRRSLLAVSMAVIGVAGCSSAPRPFDGTLGYTVQAGDNAKASITYIEEQWRSPKSEMRKVVTVCSQTLGKPADAVQVTQLSSHPEVKLAKLPMQLPTSSIRTAEGSPAMGPAAGSSPTYETGRSAEILQQEIKVRTSVYECSAK